MRHPSSSRRYIKRIWRVPKDRGALEMFATLVVKALVKHGWPATFEKTDFDGFIIKHIDGADKLAPDFENACQIAARIVARTYDVQISISENWVGLDRPYIVTPRGTFKEE